MPEPFTVNILTEAKFLSLRMRWRVVGCTNFSKTRWKFFHTQIIASRVKNDHFLIQNSQFVFDSAVSVARQYISHQKRGSNHQFSNALWKMFTEFLLQKMFILNSGGNCLYVKELSCSFRKIGAPYMLLESVCVKKLRIFFSCWCCTFFSSNVAPPLRRWQTNY